MPTFRTRVLQARVSATGLPVPPEALDELGAGKRPAVVVTVAGYTYRTSVGAMGGQHLIPLSAAHRAASGVAADDDVEVTIELDEQPRDAVIPARSPPPSPRSPPWPTRSARSRRAGSAPSWIRSPRRRPPRPARAAPRRRSPRCTADPARPASAPRSS